MLFLVTSPILSHCPHNGWPNPFLISVYPMKSAQISITPIKNSHAPFILMTPGCYKVVPPEIVSWFSTTINEFWMFLSLPWTQEYSWTSPCFMAFFTCLLQFIPLFVSCFHHLGKGMGQTPMKWVWVNTYIDTFLVGYSHPLIPAMTWGEQKVPGCHDPSPNYRNYHRFWGNHHP